MPEGFTLVCMPRRSRVLSGESLPVSVTANNEEGEGDVVLGLAPTQPIVFELLSDTGERHVRSRAIARAEADGDRARPPPKPRQFTLAAGASREFDEDPAAGSLTPIPPGRYRLIARMTVDDRHAVSDEVDIVVEAPAIGALSTLFCPMTGSHAQAFCLGGASSVLYHRETGGMLANAAVFGRCAETGAVQDLAMALHVVPGLAGRWVAWLDERGLGAVLSLGAGTITARPGPAAVALDAARFVRIGWQRRSLTPQPMLDGGEAVFMIVGLRDGVAHLQSFIVTDGAVTAGEPAPLGGQPAFRVLACQAFAAGDTYLAWAETASGSTRLVVRRMDNAMQSTTGAPRVVYERRSPLLALHMAPLAAAGMPVVVHALFGPEPGPDDQKQLVHVSVPLDGADGQAQVVSLPVPEVLPEACAISDLHPGGFVVLAKCGDDLLVITSAGPRAWRLLATDTPDLQSLQIASTARGYWAALAVDPQRGLIVLPDPDFSFEA